VNARNARNAGKVYFLWRQRRDKPGCLAYAQGQGRGWYCSIGVRVSRARSPPACFGRSIGSPPSRSTAPKPSKHATPPTFFSRSAIRATDKSQQVPPLFSLSLSPPLILTSPLSPPSLPPPSFGRKFLNYPPTHPLTTHHGYQRYQRRKRRACGQQGTPVPSPTLNTPQPRS
jgi:hypothetical protein